MNGNWSWPGTLCSRELMPVASTELPDDCCYARKKSSLGTGLAMVSDMTWASTTVSLTE